MLDLLGHEVATPPESSDYGFDQFWQAYPPGTRKVAKKQCLAKWIKHGLSSKASHIIAHVHHMKTEDCWLRGFVPMPSTYLQQERWSEWVPVPLAVRPKVDPALQKIKDDAIKAAKPSEDIRKRLSELRGMR